MFLLPQRYLILLALLVCGWIWGAQAALPAPELASVWQSQASVQQFLVSEKLDGVRARWDGQQLLSRSGLVIAAPTWFTAQFPSYPVEGELWAGNGQFEVASVAARSGADAAQWRQLKFYLFDAPNLPGTFAERYQQFSRLDGTAPYLLVIPQRQLTEVGELQQWLTQVLASGGEGLMLHHRSALYSPGRSDQLFKLKAVLDDEAQVLAILPGQGKYQGMMGALLVQTAAGVTFRLGTGFSDSERANPPAVGSWVTYAYSGLTTNGKPRFARFLRLRTDRELTVAPEGESATVPVSEPAASPHNTESR